MTELPQHHRDFTIDRFYPIGRDHVWAAWSIPEKKAAWLGNRGLKMDFHPGGTEHSTFHNERGEHHKEACYFEIKEKERIVMAYSMALDGRVHTISLATVTFQDEKGGTRLVYNEQMCVIPPSDGVEGRKFGWAALLDMLGDYLTGNRQP